MGPTQLIGDVQTPFGKAFVYVGRYPSGGTIAIQLLAGSGEPLGVFSTNLVPIGARMEHDEFWVKGWSENACLVEPMRASGLFEDTGKVANTAATSWPRCGASSTRRTCRRPASAAPARKACEPDRGGSPGQ